MQLEPIEVHLTEGQKLEVLKRFRQRFLDELDQLDGAIRSIKIELAEFDFVVQYLGEQPEVLQLKDRADELVKLNQRRDHLGKLLGRLDQVLPKQAGDKPASFQKF